MNKMETEVTVLHPVLPKICKKKIRILKKKRKKSMSKTEAARIIQRAFRRYRKRKLVKKLNNEIIMKFRPDSVKRKPRRDKVLQLFHAQKRTRSAPQEFDDGMRRTFYNPVKENLVFNGSLYQQDRETVLVFGGVDTHNDFGVGRNTGKNIYRYSANENTWEFVGELPEPRHHHSVQFLKERVFLVGGSDPSEEESTAKSIILRSVWSFDPVTKNWFSEPSLQEARKNFGLVACNQNLYAIGGQGKDYESLESVESFNIEQRSWETRAPMRHSRIGLACSEYKDCIWVAGGLTGMRNKRTLLDCVESYNLRNDQWTEIRQSLHFPRCFSRLFSIGERLYLIGGAGKSPDKNAKGTISVGDIDLWDPRNSEWRTITKMHIARHGHSVAYLGTQILIVGGVTAAYKRALSSTECFCSQRGTLVRGLACIPTGLSGHASVTLPPASQLTSLAR